MKYDRLDYFQENQIQKGPINVLSTYIPKAVKIALDFSFHDESLMRCIFIEIGECHELTARFWIHHWLK